MDTWVKKAYDNWSQVVEYDGKSLMNFKQIKKSSTSALGPVNYPNSLDNQLPQQRLRDPVPSEPLVDQSDLSGGEQYFCYLIVENY